MDAAEAWEIFYGLKEEVLDALVELGHLARSLGFKELADAYPSAASSCNEKMQELLTEKLGRDPWDELCDEVEESARAEPLCTLQEHSCCESDESLRPDFDEDGYGRDWQEC